MSKLYSMIEDALLKKGLNIPSDLFTFREDSIPSEEKLDKSDADDGIKEPELPHINDKSLKSFDAKDDNILTNIFTDDEIKELKSYITANDLPKGELRDFYNQLAVLQGEEFFKQIAQELYTFWLNSESIKKSLKNISEMNSKIESTPELKDKVEQTKNSLIDAFKMSQKGFFIWYFNLLHDPILNVYGSKPVQYLIDNFANVTDGGTIVFEDNMLKAYHDSDLYKPSLNYGDIEPLSLKSVKNDPNIVSVYANVEKVKEVLRKNNLSDSFVVSTFPFVDLPGHTPWTVKIMGVPADEKEQYPLKYVYLERWKDRGSENTIHRKASTIYKVPFDLVKSQLPDTIPERVRGTPSKIVNEGEFIQLSKGQIERVLLQQMYDYKMGRNNNTLFAEDLIKIFRETPDANIISKALKTFEPDVNIRRGTKDGDVAYYINIPYVGSKNKLDNNTNYDLRRFNKLVRR